MNSFSFVYRTNGIVKSYVSIVSRFIMNNTSMKTKQSKYKIQTKSNKNVNIKLINMQNNMKIFRLKSNRKRKT